MPDTTGTRLRRNEIDRGKKAKAQPFSFCSGKQTWSCTSFLWLLQCCATVSPLSHPGTLSHDERIYTPKPTQRWVSLGRRRFSQLSGQALRKSSKASGTAPRSTPRQNSLGLSPRVHVPPVSLRQTS